MIQQAVSSEISEDQSVPSLLSEGSNEQHGSTADAGSDFESLQSVK